MNSRQPSTLAIVAPDLDFNGTGVWFPEGTNPEARLIYGVTAQTVSKGGHVYFTGEAHGGLRGMVYVLGRLKPDGTLDTSFAEATKGIASGNFITNSGSAGFSINLLDDGKILLVGLARNRRVPALARFNSDGTLDTTFGPAENGNVVLEDPLSDSEPSDTDPLEAENFTTGVMPLATGKILIVHTYIVTHTADTRAFIFALNSNGTLDTTFNETGHLQVLEPGVSPDSVKLRSSFIDDKGNIVVGGSLTADRKPAGIFFARYTAEGAPDKSFNEAGVRVFNTPDLVDASFNSVIRQTNNRLLGVGNTPDGRGLLISLEPDGKDNIQFNGGKPLLTRLEANLTRWRTATMQPDGKILLMGAITSPEPPPSPSQSYGVLARLLSDGKADTDFNAGSFWIKARASTFLSSLALQEDGKIIVGGFERSTGSDKALVMRFHDASTE